MIRVQPDDAPTAPLPELSQFFTWSPTDDPNPYPPPGTDIPPVAAGATSLTERPALPATSAAPRVEPVRARRSKLGVSVTKATGATPTRRKPRVGSPPVVLWSIFAVVTTIAAVLWSILLWPSSDSTTMTTSPHEPTTTAEVERLRRSLPPGYPPQACAPIPHRVPALAALQCGSHPAIPAANTAHYTLYEVTTDLDTAFTAVTAATAPQVCPGGYQSPGAWRRNASPELVAGTLLCGTNQAAQPTVAWTTESTLVLATINADTPQFPTLAQLYTWWSTHS